jgi:uncharacterized membrane protein YccC
MIKRHNGLSWLFVIIGLILAPFLFDLGGYSYIGYIGSILIIIGLSLYANAKGRHPAWGLFGLLSVFGAIIGWIVIWLLKDYSTTTLEKKEDEKKI